MNMTRRGWMAVVCAGFLMGWGVSAMAQEAPPAGEPGVMNQQQFADILVRKLGLFRLLPGTPGALDSMILLTQYGIYPSVSSKPTDADPAPGWSLDPNAPVTLEQFAVVMVRALKLQDTVEGDVMDPQNWLDALKKAGVEVTNVADGVASLVPLEDIPAMQPIFEVTGDPITLRFIPDSVVALINTISFPEFAPAGQKPQEEGRKPRPVTPT